MPVDKALKAQRFYAAHAAKAAERCGDPREIFDCAGNSFRAARQRRSHKRWQLMQILELS